MVINYNLYCIMKKTFFLLMAACVFALCACEKENEPAATPNDTTAGTETGLSIAGEYDMTIVYDSICTDGRWFENGMGRTYADEHGRMTVSVISDDTIRIEGITTYEMSGNEEITYSTVAAKQPDGTYIPQQGSHVIEGVTFIDHYRPISFESDTLMRFQVVEKFVMYNLPMAYLRTVTCIKR